MNFFGLPVIVLAAGGFLLAASPAWSSGNQPSSPPAIGQSTAATVEKARALINKGRHNEALVLLRPLVEHRPVDKDVLFLIGLAAIGAAQRPGLSEKARDTLLDAAIPALAQIAGQRTQPGSRPAGARPGVLPEGPRTLWRRGISSRFWRANRRRLWCSTSTGSSRRCGRESAGTCAWVWRWRRTAISARVRGSERF